MTPIVTFSRPRIRRTLLRAVQSAFHLSGLDTAFVRTRAPQGAMILVYHGIVGVKDAPWVDPRFSVTASLFEAQMRFLARHRRVLSLSALLDKLRGGAPIDPGTVVITFDDGYRSTLDVAAPVLKHYDLPAAVYLPTRYIDWEEPQFVDALYSAFNFRTRNELDLSCVGQDRIVLSDEAAVRRTYLALEERMTGASPDRRTEMLSEVVDQLRPSRRPPRLTLSWQEVDRLCRTSPRIEIGAHTRHHVDLTRCSPRAALEEVEGSAGDIRRELGRTPEHFSFPFGRSNATARAAVERARLESAAVTEPAALVRAGADALALPRLSAPSHMCLFSFFTSGAYPELSLSLLRRA